MLIGFIIFGFGWSLVWQAQGKATTQSIFEMPLWCSTRGGKTTLFLLTIFCGISHLIIAIFIFSWIGILFWLICALITQLISAAIFHNSRTKNPAPPLSLGILSMIIGLIIMLINTE